MDISLFLAKVLGLYFIIVSIGLWRNNQVVEALASKIIENPALLFLIGAYDIAIGLLVVLSHNIWEADWRVIITIIGWLILIRGILRFYFPNKLSNFFSQKKESILALMPVFAGVILLLGLYLAIMGFYPGGFKGYLV